jgi:membrane fusion protein (multidrug efflux system)
MFMLAAMDLDRRTAALLIPEEALVPTADRQFVYIVDENRARLVEVRIGQRLTGQVEVISGLSAGQQIVVAGVQRLRNGAQVRVIGADGQPAGGAPRGGGQGGGGQGGGQRPPAG